MDDTVALRIGIFIALFAVFAAAERLRPRRPLRVPLRRRWTTAWMISLLGSALLAMLSLLVPLLAIGAAHDAAAQGWGLFNVLEAPSWLEGLTCILLLDAAIWGQHRLSHTWSLLWRLHRVHHADIAFDVSTAIRFHPLEIGLSMLIKIALVYTLGAPAWSVVIFEILLNGTALFNHANWHLPPAIDRALRRVLVTPDMHRIHHSALRHEHNSNFGFALSLWDRLFGTYRELPQAGHRAMTIGLQWRDDRPTRLGWSLWLPLARDGGSESHRRDRPPDDNHRKA